MARHTDIRLRRSAVSGNQPGVSDLNLGELAINTADGKVYMKKSVGGTDTIVEVGSGGGIAASFTAYEYTATSSQTTFSGSDSYSNTLAYNTGTPPKVQVFMNGILLDEGSSADYTGTNGTSIVLTTAADAGDLIQIHAYKSDVSIVSNLLFNDNQKLQFGDSQDLQIYHDANNSYIKDQGTGQLVIDGNAVILQYSSGTRLTTTSAGISVTGNISVSGTVDGIDIAARDAILTSTTTTAGAALPKAGGAMTGAITTNSTFDGRDVATDGTKLDTIETSATADQTQAEINALGITATGLSGTPNIGVGTISSGNITTTGYLRGPSTFTIDPAAHGDDTGTLVIAGNLQVDGTTTTINSTTLTVDDKNITLASGSANAAAANGAGLTVDGASATLTYVSTGDKWSLNKPLDVLFAGDDGVKIESSDNHSSLFIDSHTAYGQYIRFTENNANKYWINSASGKLVFRPAGTSTVTSQVVFDASGNVGIGTASPNTQLQINNATDPKIRLESNESGSKRLDLWIDGGTAIGYIAADQSASQLAFKTAGTERMRIDSTGNVGIGTTNPSSTFQVEGTGDYLANFKSSDATSGIKLTDSSSQSRVVNISGHLVLVADANNNSSNSTIRFNIDTASVAASDSSMILTSTGLGIGTSSPSSPLHVTAAKNDGWLAQLINTGTGGDANGLDIHAGVDVSDYILRVREQDGTDVMAVKYGGNVGIGTTSPGYDLDILDTSTASNTGAGVNIAHATQPQLRFTQTTGNYRMYLGIRNNDLIIANDSGAEKVRFEQNGNVGIGINTPTARLDVRRGDADGKIAEFHQNAGYGIDIGSSQAVAYISSGYNQRLDFKTDPTSGQTERMSILANGNVGIGTTTPSELLEVRKDSANAVIKVQTGGGNDARLILDAPAAAGAQSQIFFDASGTTAGSIQYTHNSGGTNFMTFGTGGSNTERMRIHSAGGLSVGTNAAAPAGGILSDNDIKSNSRFGVGSGGSLSDAAIYKNSDTNTGIYWPGTDQIALTTAGSSRLHINSSGGVSLGTQSQLTTGGAARLSIIDSSVQLSMGASNSDMSYIRKNGAGQFAWQTYNSSGNSGILQFQPYGGNVTINTTAAVSGHALSVSGKIGGLTYSDSYLQFTGGNATLKANDDVILGYSSYVYVKQAGKVGLGTSDPKSEFQVYHAGIDTYAVNTSATSAAQVDTFSSTEFRSARFTVQITNTTDSTYQITEILLIHDGTTPSMTEYSTIFTGSAREASFDADIVSSNVRLLATPASTDSMQFKVVRHSILV